MTAVPGSRTALRVVDLAPGDARWDDFVSSQARASIFHHGAWLRVLEREYGRAAMRLAALDGDGSVRGVLPLMRTRGLPLGLAAEVGSRRLSSLPRTPVAGPLADRADALRALVEAAGARRPDGTQLQLKLAAPLPADALPGLTCQTWRMTYAVDLPPLPEEIRFGPTRRHGRVMARVRHAQREGVSVRSASSVGELRRWYRLHLEVMRHNVVPPRRWRLFSAMWEELRPLGMMDLLLAERDGQMLAGNVMLQGPGTAFYAFNGADRSSFELRANDLLQWEGIRRAQAAGLHTYDLGEVPEGEEGLIRFKRKWGAEPRPLVRCYSPAPSVQTGRTGGGAAPQRAARLAEEAWRRTPLPATALAGSLFYRFL